MGIFYRRRLQRLLDAAVSAGLTRTQAKALANKLATRGQEALAAEWEIAVGGALAARWDLTYEPTIKGARTPDFLLDHRGGGRARPSSSIVVEVVAASDRGLDEAFPVKAFVERVKELAARLGVPAGALSFELGMRHGQPGSSRTGPRFLASSQVQSFVHQRVGPFLRRVAHNPGSPDLFDVNEPEIDAMIRYTPGQPYLVVAHSSYDKPGDLERNPIARALKKKARQLDEIADSLPTIVVVCDAGCASFGDHGLERRVVADFFRKHSGVAGVILLSVQQESDSSQRRAAPLIHWQRNRRARRPIPVRDVRQLVGALATLRGVASAPRDARSNLKRIRKPWWGSDYGSWRIKGKEIQMSLRGLQLLLAGEVTYEAFLRDHRMLSGDPEQAIANVFESWSRAGHTIESIRLTEGRSEDDAKVILRFSSEPDPALVGVLGAKR